MANNGDSKTVFQVNRTTKGNYEIMIDSKSMSELYTALGLVRLHIDNMVCGNMTEKQKTDIIVPQAGLRNFLDKRRGT